MEASQVQKALDGFESFVTAQLQAWKAPGVAVSVVKDGEVVLAQGYGFRDLEQQLPMTSKTLLAIGSSSKAFTTTAVAMLVEDGKLDWDQPVQRYLPGLRLYDPVASAKVTLRDMGCHRTGLPRYDIMLFNPAFSREDIVRSLEHLEPSRDFRTAWQYQNLMYATMGYVVGKVAGTTWEDFVRERIFQPLGMGSSNFSVVESQKSEDFGLPYGKNEEEVKRMEFLEISATGPAGNINSNVEEMAHWVMLNLDKGKFKGQELVSADGIMQLHSPHIMLPQTGRHPEITFSSYGLGWFANTYRGHTVVHHGGNTAGFSAMVSMIPGEKLGVVVLTNMNSCPLPDIIANYVFDRFLGLEPLDWSQRYQAELSRFLEARAKQDEAIRLGRKEGTSPSHPLQEYAGQYQHPGAGTLAISVDGESLQAVYGRVNLAMIHHHHDTFQARFEIVGHTMTMLANFATDTKGRVRSVAIPLGLEPGAKELVFLRVPDQSLAADPRQYAGEYELGGTTITVSVRGEDTLVMVLPGQPTYQLVPAGEHSFDIKGLTSFAVRFNTDEGRVVELVLIQPTGVFTARRK
ncbi:MAG: serine hydrolase [Bacillota bacterium]